MTGKVALITGAASGQGAGVAETLASDGYAVGLLDVDEPHLAEVSARIGREGGAAICLAADVSDRGQVEGAVAQLESKLGTPWLVGAAAAILEGGFAVSAPVTHWQRVTDVNYLGIVNVNAVAAARMIEAGHGGRIVNWSSVTAGLCGAGYSAYAASKAALEAFSRALSIELAPHRITVNVIRPGSILTPMLRAFDEQDIANEAVRTPLGRWGTPADVAAAVRYLASEAADWVTGSVIAVDGGAAAAAGGASAEAIGKRHARERELTAERGS